MVLWNILRQKNNLFIIAFVIIPDRQFQLFPTVHPGTLSAGAQAVSGGFNPAGHGLAFVSSHAQIP